MLQDIELLESGSILEGLRFPHKIKKVTQIVITAGQLSCLVVSSDYCVFNLLIGADYGLLYLCLLWFKCCHISLVSLLY